MISNAIGSERLSAIVGYKLTTGNFATSTPNLPARIAIIGEANADKQSGLSTDPVEITSAQQAGAIFGFGSPIYNVLRILRPVNGDGVGGIPTIVYPQEEAESAAARVQTITVTGTATGSGIHYVKIGGRDNLDGAVYAVNIALGDTATIIAEKIRDAINAVLGCPVSATAAVAVVTITTKWKGLTAQDITIEMDSNTNGFGVTYVVAQTTAGAGTPSIADALALFGTAWNTIVINTYGTVSTVMQSLEAFNGVPDPINPTGRYQGVIMKPFIALTGSVDEDPSSITDSRKTQLTIAICPAPLSKGHPMEAAANMAVLFSRISQDTPHLDVQGLKYPDMPTPVSIGKMDKYTERDAIIKKGCSTVELIAGVYRVVDFVTTYHPDGEIPAQFRYCRNLILDFNVRFGYYLLEQTNVLGHAIAGDSDIVSVSKIIKPKQWKAIIKAYAIDLSKRGLIADYPFMHNSIQCDISTSNPDRLEIFFRYKRTGFMRIASTTAEAGFNFGVQ
ncbi:MAG: hypothetical protein KL787_10035 [Taibaiella sp.]|nr:hypothetical protein [Taibaiella sp.]